MSNNVRFATENDLSKILFFIKELAEYEKMSNLVVATEQDLKNYIFDKKIANVIFILEDGKEVGFALYFYSYSTFLGKAGIHLEDLFVMPEYRGKGYGKTLLISLAKIAKQQGCGRLEWTWLNWNKPSIEFYQKLGAKLLDEWLIFRLDENGIKNLCDKEKD